MTGVQTCALPISYFFRLIRNTFLLSTMGLIFSFPAPVIFALALNELRSNKFKRVAQTISYLPYFISTVVLVGILMTLFSYDGIINSVITFLGGSTQNFFNDPKWFRTLYIGSGIWQGVGWGSIIYLAALSGVPTELYEAAAIDGANRWKQMLHITLPSLVPTMTILMIMNLGNMLNIGFEKVYLMYNPGIYETADVISTYVYRRGIIGMDYSYSTAVGLFNSVVSLILIAIANAISRKVTETSLW